MDEELLPPNQTLNSDKYIRTDFHSGVVFCWHSHILKKGKRTGRKNFSSDCCKTNLRCKKVPKFKQYPRDQSVVSVPAAGLWFHPAVVPTSHHHQAQIRLAIGCFISSHQQQRYPTLPDNIFTQHIKLL